MDKQEEEEQMWLDDEMDGMYVKLLLFKQNITYNNTIIIVCFCTMNIDDQIQI